MSTQSSANTPNASSEQPASTFSGYLMLVIALALLGVVISLFGGSDATADPKLDIGIGISCTFALTIISAGFYMLQPNQAAVITLFGAYRGTDRNTGLRWVWPWMGKTKMSLRANNLISEQIKVNDLRGNPIEIAAQVVWRVTDTAQAMFDVDDYRAFVAAQIEAAVRTIGSRYPYDDIEHQEITLRGNHDLVGFELQKALLERLTVAGISVDECGFTHLAYAPEIAGAMLRRQQAEAIISARRKLVEGAVSMVELALTQLSERGVVEFDASRKAALVSNLMVVLCGERDTQPVVNTGA